MEQNDQPQKPRSRRRTILIVLGIALLACCGITTLSTLLTDSDDEPISTAAIATEGAQRQDTNAAAPTDTLVPDATPEPTNTPAPTATPLPTDTPVPTATPAATATPAVYTGSGDAIVDVEKGPEPAVAYITGNASSRFFGVKSIDENNDVIDLLVNSTEPYEGIVPLDFGNSEHTHRFEVQANGPWTIEVRPLVSVERLEIPGTISGTGDYVFAIVGGTPDKANITGNEASRFFGVKSYGNFVDLLVNSTDPYDGTVLLDADTVVIEVQAVGDWTIEIETR